MIKKHFIVSDFHLNMGRIKPKEVPDGPDGTRRNWKLHPLEDFDADDQFERLLDLARRSEAELVINGDWIDFLQLEPVVTVGHRFSPDGIPLAWTHREAQEKLETCFSNNPLHFQALEDYLKTGGKLSVLQGNHDPEWFFPAEDAAGDPPVQKMLRQRLGGPDRDSLRFEESHLRLGSVHVEHGHQSCEAVNAFQNHPKIFHLEKGKLTGPWRIELVWGSRLVLEFFNDLEREHPYADNLKTTTRALWLGIKNGWVNGSLAADFLKFLWGAGTSLRHVGDLLGPTERDPVRMMKGLENEELRDLFIQRFRNDAKFRKELEANLKSMPSEEANSLSRRATRSEIGREEMLGHGSELLGVVRKPRELRSAEAILKQPGVTAVVFGHTHQEIDGNSDEAPIKNYFNTGTWTPRFDLRKAENKQLLKGKFPVEVLSDRKHFERVLPYAEVQVDRDATSIELKYM